VWANRGEEVCCSGSNFCGLGEEFCGSANWCQGRLGACDKERVREGRAPYFDVMKEQRWQKSSCIAPTKICQESL